MPLNEEAIRFIHARVGTVVRGKYRLNRVLGVGGMAAVFDATHRNGARVALKVLHQHLAQLPVVRLRFLREAYAANRIGHPGVVRVIDDDVDEAEGIVFLVMELLEGETIEARRARFGGRLPLVEAIDACDRILDVLAVAHEQGVVHRDLKPDNLFLTADGGLKILDFGIARLLDGTGATRSGELLGTPAFMSPEQANGRTRDVDAKSDLWAVGAVLFVLVSGRDVHEGATASERLVHAATRPAPPIQRLLPWLEQPLAMAIDRALAFERDARWPNAREMQAALRATAAFAQCIRFRSGVANRPAASSHAAFTRTLDAGQEDTFLVSTGPTGTLIQPPAGTDSGGGKRR